MPDRQKAEALAAHAKALTEHAAALRAHTKAIGTLNATLTKVTVGKTISRATILARLTNFFHKPGASVKEKDSIGKYVKGGPGALAALAQSLNNSAEFKLDGLDLVSNDTSFVTTVGELINAIGTWYTNNHWTVAK